MNNPSNIYETLEVIGQVLIRCFVMGIIVLLFWAGAVLFAGDLVYSVHSKLLNLAVSRPQFDVIHYGGMTLTKLVVFVLFLFPYIGIRLVINRQEAEGKSNELEAGNRG